MSTINELPARTTLADTDVFAVDTGSVTNKVTLPNLGAAMKGMVFAGVTTTGITEYPTKPGLYRVAGATISGMPSGATKYGLLRIESACPPSTYAYASHVYTDSNNAVFVGWSGDTFGVPASWINISGTVPISRGGTGATSAAAALENLGASIYLDGTYNTLAKIYPVLTKIPTTYGATFYMAPTPAALLGNGKLPSAQYPCGFVTRVNASGFRFFVITDNGKCYMWNITNWTSATATPTISTVYMLQGTSV